MSGWAQRDAETKEEQEQRFADGIDDIYAVEYVEGLEAENKALKASQLTDRHQWALKHMQALRNGIALLTRDALGDDEIEAFPQRILDALELKSDDGRGVDVLVAISSLRQALADAQAERDEAKAAGKQSRGVAHRLLGENQKLVERNQALTAENTRLQGEIRPANRCRNFACNITVENDGETFYCHQCYARIEDRNKTYDDVFVKWQERLDPLFDALAELGYPAEKMDDTVIEETLKAIQALQSELADYKSERNCKACDGTGGQRDSSEPDANEEPCDACLGSGSQLVADEFAERLAMIDVRDELKAVEAERDRLLKARRIARIEELNPYKTRLQEALGSKKETFGVLIENLIQQRNALKSQLATARQDAIAWQPISTAPKDGTSVLLAWHWSSGGGHSGVCVVQASWICRKHCYVAKRHNCPDESDCEMGWDSYGGEMTHWQPLPALPISPDWADRRGGGRW